MKFGRLMVAGALWLAGVTTMAHAQSPEESRAEIPSLVRGAFDSAYGKALVAELGKSLRKDADPACLAAKGIAPEQLEQRGRDLVIKWDEKLLLTLNDFIDPKVYEEKFTGAAGRGAGAEFKRLRNDPAVKKSLELELPIRQASVLDAFFEQFDRYMLVKRIKLMAVSPLGTANEALLKMNPTDAAEAAVDKYLATNKSAALTKFVKLSEQSAAASGAAAKLEQMAKTGPLEFLNGIDADLAELCIGPAK
ncbi:hypothetical protein JQ628_17245 [Bradyrhizobium lablabi]|uniref:hypothetical protein n=1 Tax=Bradyrhizobium lablabi TaxID=722472 RepID=UPI001BA6AD67|nr:hypothetical protein [Bradyrhizobium lablabi]MBR1123276.1 hypothetical protein [Bradyrhizobium lablabi]